MAYPNSLDSFTTKTDGIDDVMAADINRIQSAIAAVETELGTLPKGALANVATRLSGIESGWIPSVGIWTYSTPNLLNMPAGGNGIYPSYAKAKFTQHGVVKQGYIIAGSSTTLIFYGGSGAAIENTSIYPITDAYYSTSENPLGFTQWFNLTAPMWTTSGTAFTNQPITDGCKFSISGKTLSIVGQAHCHANSGGTGMFIATFPDNSLPPFPGGNQVGISVNTVSGASGWSRVDYWANNKISIARFDGVEIAINGQYFSYKIDIQL